MRLSATVTIDGNTQTITSRPVDVVKWEAGSKRRITDGMGFGDMARIIHSAARRQGLTDLTFDAWIDAVDDFTPQADEDPTQPQPEAS